MLSSLLVQVPLRIHKSFFFGNRIPYVIFTLSPQCISIGFLVHPHHRSCDCYLCSLSLIARSASGSPLLRCACRIRLGLEGYLTPLEAARLGSVVEGTAYFNPFAPQGHYNLDMTMPSDRDMFRTLLSLDKVRNPTQTHLAFWCKSFLLGVLRGEAICKSAR